MFEAPAPVPFGAPERRHNLERMAEETLDALVIGGGITGVAVARDLALRGFDAGLVEMGDYASGTSSTSSQLIHGGLRYLEHLDFDLVFEALRERRVLLQTAPHLVTPREFLFPIYEGDRTGPFRLRLGLILYDLLAGFRSIGRHRTYRTADADAVEPGLNTSGLRSLAGYFDASTNDSRLTITIARSAAAAGALCANYARVLDLLADDGRVAGARVHDELTGEELEIRARATVNATGVWAPRILEMASRPLPGLVRPSRGSHLVVERDRLPVHHALIFESPVDGRIIFVIPWGFFTLIGTTEVEHAGPLEEVHATADEVAYLLQSLDKVFPAAEITPSDVCATYAGLRPLVAEQTREPAGAISREHTILDEPAGLFTIVGGKLTTHRLMGQQTADRVADFLHSEFDLPAREEIDTRELPLVGAPAPDRLHAIHAEAARTAERLGLPDRSHEHLVRRYGTGFREITDSIEVDPSAGELLAPPLPYTAAEARYSARMEMAVTLADFMTRRTHLVYAGRHDHRAVAERVARALAPTLDWSPDRVQSELDAYASVRNARRAALE